MPITPNQFKNMADLIQFLNDLEKKVDILEEQNAALRTSLEEMQQKNHELGEFLKDSWPKTSLFHNSFWVRALTIFGHNLVIQLIVGVILFALYLIVVLPLMAAFVGQIPGLAP